MEGFASWLEVEAEVEPGGDGQPRRGLRPNWSIECSSCGSGICCPTPPERCPMCQAEDGWVHAPWRPFLPGVGSVI
jgi:hypothetical protein